MSYQIATSNTGNTYIVLAQGSKIIRVVRKCEDRDDAKRLLNDLSNWGF